jgi:hypothetical protein
MKKKLKDLTLKEAQQICNNRPVGSGLCPTCPLRDLCRCNFDYEGIDLDREVEVEE